MKDNWIPLPDPDLRLRLSAEERRTVIVEAWKGRLCSQVLDMRFEQLKALQGYVDVLKRENTDGNS